MLFFKKGSVLIFENQKITSQGLKDSKTQRTSLELPFISDIFGHHAGQCIQNWRHSIPKMPTFHSLVVVVFDMFDAWGQKYCFFG